MLSRVRFFKRFVVDLPRQARLAYCLMRDPRVSLRTKIAFGAGIAGLTGTLFASLNTAVFASDFDTPLLITVYAMLISLAVGVAGFAFPFLPRHLTLVGAITIGIPSFFLALAPNTERFRPGFVERVLRFAIPTGTLAAIATFVAYTLAKNDPGVTLVQAQTTAVMVLTFIGLLVLSILAAPLTRGRLMLIWAMAGLFLLILNLPQTREFFALSLPPTLVWLAAFGIAA